MSAIDEIEFLKIQTHVLKVQINCAGCRKKVKKLLKKIEGVYQVSMDIEEQKVIVSGNVDAEIVIMRLLKSGKHAELLSLQEKGSSILKLKLKHFSALNSTNASSISSVTYKSLDAKKRLQLS